MDTNKNHLFSKIVTVVGTRPQFVKASVVSKALRQHPKFREVLIHTGQHYDDNMSDIFFRELEIGKPAYELNIGSLNHGAQTGRMLEALEKVLLEERPNLVLVYGDTNSTLAAALAASKLHIPVAHVEAGLRSQNMKMAEEVNRILTDHVSTILFAPTELAKTNLLIENIGSQKVFMVGDVMYDLSLHLSGNLMESNSRLEEWQLKKKQYALVTLHRAENTDNYERLSTLWEAFKDVATRLPVLLPLHPRTQKMCLQFGIDMRTPEIRIVEPLGYRDMAIAESNAAVIATDSGGVQKEAYFYGVPCVTLRNETEWMELVDTGWNRVVPPVSRAAVAQSILGAFNPPGLRVNLYGDGHASEKIAEILATQFPP